MSNFRAYLLSAVFFIPLLILLANQVHPFIIDAEYNESKQKAELPEFDIKKLDTFPAKFEMWLNDNFSLRGFFLNEIGYINIKLWKKSPKPDKVIIGKNGWLFNVNKDFDTYRGKRVFSNEDLEKVIENFKYRKKVLDSMGIELLIVIDPIKYSVYPEYLPASLKYTEVPELTNQFIDAIHKNTDIDLLYTRDVIMKNKENERMFFKNDNHWNDYAGYYAGKEIINRIKLSNKAEEIDLARFCADSVIDFKGNLAHMTGNAKLYEECRLYFKFCDNDAAKFKRFEHECIAGFSYPWAYQYSYVTKNENLPNALIIRDSSCDAMIPYLRNSFHYSTFIFDAWQYRFNLDIIQKEQPDIVIYTILESLLPGIVNGL